MSRLKKRVEELEELLNPKKILGCWIFLVGDTTKEEVIAKYERENGKINWTEIKETLICVVNKHIWNKESSIQIFVPKNK